MRRILPIEKVVYKSSLSKREVYDRLNEAIAIHQTYKGNWSDNTFSITRRIRSQNSFLPQIKGKIQEEPDGVLIIVRMRLHLLVIAFLAVCFYILLSTSYTDQFSLEKTNILYPMGILIFGFVLVLAAFKFESSKSKRDLKYMFDAEIVK